MTTLKIICADEAQSTHIEIPDFHPCILLPGSERYITLIYQSDGYWFRVGNYVGVIPAAKGYVIQIRPKINISDLTYLLLQSGLLNRSLQTPFESTVPYQISSENLESFFEALIMEFLKQVDRIRALGLLRGEKRKTIVSSSITGRTDTQGTLRIYPRTYGTKVSQVITEHPFSTPENRLLFYCLTYLLGVPLQVTSTIDIAKRLIYFSSLKNEQMNSTDWQEVTRVLEHGKIPTQRSYYIPALNLAMTILSGVGITIGEQADVEFKPLIINTADMFEKYVRNILRVQLHRTGVSVFDGRSQPRSFYTSGPKPVELKPDVLFTLGGNVLSVLDIKYKSEPTEADHYQMWAYLEGFDLAQAIMIYVSTDEGKVEEYHRRGRKLITFGFNLGQIKQSENALNHLILSILKL